MEKIQKKVIYVDMDGVIADFNKKKEDTPEEVLNAYDNRADLIPDFFKDLPLVPGAKDAMKILNKKLKTN